MRITSGFARGIFLDAPRGDNTRPATDAARQAIFSSLGDFAVGAKVLDLFAGTGSYGLEALSRGAAEAFFVESDRNALAVLRANIARVKKAVESAGEKFSAKVIAADCTKCALLSEKSFDIVFADPPYRMYDDPKTAPKLFALFAQLSSPDTLFIIEAPAQFALSAAPKPDGFAFSEIKRLGKKSAGKPSQIIFKIEKQ